MRSAPVTRIQHVGMIVEFIAQAFRIPEDKIKIAPLREQILCVNPLRP